MKTKLPKYRVRGTGILKDRKLTACYIVEFQIGRRWQPLGDPETGIEQYASRDLADAAAKEILAQLTPKKTIGPIEFENAELGEEG